MIQKFYIVQMMVMLLSDVQLSMVPYPKMITFFKNENMYLTNECILYMLDVILGILLFLLLMFMLI